MTIDLSYYNHYDDKYNSILFMLFMLMAILFMLMVNGYLTIDRQVRVTFVEYGILYNRTPNTL